MALAQACGGHYYRLTWTVAAFLQLRRRPTMATLLCSPRSSTFGGWGKSDTPGVLVGCQQMWRDGRLFRILPNTGPST